MPEVPPGAPRINARLLPVGGTPSSTPQVSIGAIQAVESLGRVIRREAEAIAFAAFDAFGKPQPSIRVDEGYIARVQKVRESRRPSQGRLEKREGTITALDIVAKKLHLRRHSSGERLKGTFSMLFQPTLVERLGRHVRLHGVVERRAAWKAARFDPCRIGRGP